MTSGHPGITAPGLPGATRYLCPLCDWWLDVPPPSIPQLGDLFLDPMRSYLDAVAAVEGALAGHFATTQHRLMAYGHGPWTVETLEPCRCGHPRGDHFRHDGQCLHSTATETWACDCDGVQRASPRWVRGPSHSVV